MEVVQSYGFISLIHLAFDGKGWPLLAWRIPGTGEPGGLPSMGSHRVGHDSSDLAIAIANYAKSTSK